MADLPSDSSVTDPNYVDEATWAQWERDRAAANAAYDARRQLERARPVQPTREDSEAQLHALRGHNAALVAERDRLAYLLRSLLTAHAGDAMVLAAVLDERAVELRAA
jgi:hypothetical protein